MSPRIVVSVLIMSCAGPALEEELATIEQAATTPLLFELDGVSAGSVSAVTSSTGGTPCGAKTLVMSLGANLSTPALAWLDSVLAGTQGLHTGAVSLANAQRLSFEVAQVSALELPRANSNSSATVGLQLSLTLTKSSTCTTVSTSVAAAKAKLAATWASRSALEKTVEVRLGAVVFQPPFQLRELGGASIGDATATSNVSQAAQLQALLDTIWNKHVVDVATSTDLRVIPRDQQGAPLFDLRWYGPATLVTDGGTSFSLTVNRPHLAATLPDGGLP